MLNNNTFTVEFKDFRKKNAKLEDHKEYYGELKKFSVEDLCKKGDK